MIASGLDGTKVDKEVVFVRSAAKLPKVMKAGKYASVADDNGAIGAWIDDAGQLRCEALRRWRTIDAQIFTTFKAVKEWWVKWLKEIG